MTRDREFLDHVWPRVDRVAPGLYQLGPGDFVSRPLDPRDPDGRWVSCTPFWEGADGVAVEVTSRDGSHESRALDLPYDLLALSDEDNARHYHQVVEAFCMGVRLTLTGSD